jgi:uncharacterized cupin superfamily protein
VDTTLDKVTQHLSRLRGHNNQPWEDAVEQELLIRIEHDPSDERLEELGVKTWPIWSCEPSEFPWEYDTAETCLILEGDVEVTPEGSPEPVRIGRDDLVTFPAGLKCVWKVHSAVRKHYNFG